ncbi:MAG: RNA-binding cell elongation regulator Jag/EloR [Candidatus Omnitrophota bacterium]
MKEALGEGNTLEEATQNALQQLMAKREEVEINPMSAGSKGFLGFGRKKAVVKASLRPDDRIRASVFMRNILQRMKIDSPIDVREEGENLFIVLGESASSLIGHHGQTLDSLQYLVARYLNEDKEDWRKVVIDIDNYREKREDNLRAMALRWGEQVARTKQDYRTDPLSPPERRIIHLALKENAEVTTFSIGNGTHKRVVIASTDRSASSSAPRRRPQRRGGRSGGGGGYSGRGGSGSGSGGGGGRGRRRPSRPREGSGNR